MATKYKGYMGNMLRIDLGSGEITEFDVSDSDKEMYLGGKGLAAKMLYDMQEAGVDPLSPEAMLIVNTGPLNGSNAPCTSRFNMTARSPLTGGMGTANSGGNFGFQLKRCGYDALVITGRAEKPVYIDITDNKAEIKDASHLWGRDTEETQEAMEKRAGKLAIGPAGENLVKYACVMSGERASGRCGLGAVMGSKNLKAVQAKGSQKTPVHDEEGFKSARRMWTEILKKHPVTGDSLPKYGTAGFLNKVNITNTLPTKNFERGNFENAEKISGETLADEHLVKTTGCLSCPIRCGRVVNVDGKDVKGPEFETLGLFGSNLLIDDLQAINKWNRQMDLLGLDTISCGNTIGFAMELTEKKMMESELEFGRTDNISQVIEDIAYRRGAGDELAEGARALSEKYGGEDFAIHVKGLEIASYEPRSSVGMGLGYATANRGGCHLNAGYMVFFERLGPINVDPYTHAAKAGFTIFQQNIFEAVNSCGNCVFTTYAIVPPVAWGIRPYSTTAKVMSKVMTASGPVLDITCRVLPKVSMHMPSMIPHTLVISKLTGMDMHLGNFAAAGERGYIMERLFNLREGIGGELDTLPKRLTDVPQDPSRPETKVPLDKMLPHYYKVRGWDRKGVPTEKKLRQLGMQDYAV